MNTNLSIKFVELANLFFHSSGISYMQAFYSLTFPTIDNSHIILTSFKITPKRAKNISVFQTISIKKSSLRSIWLILIELYPSNLVHYNWGWSEFLCYNDLNKSLCRVGLKSAKSVKYAWKSTTNLIIFHWTDENETLNGWMDYVKLWMDYVKLWMNGWYIPPYGT